MFRKFFGFLLSSIHDIASHNIQKSIIDVYTSISISFLRTGGGPPGVLFYQRFYLFIFFQFFFIYFFKVYF